MRGRVIPALSVTHQRRNCHPSTSYLSSINVYSSSIIIVTPLFPSFDQRVLVFHHHHHPSVSVPHPASQYNQSGTFKHPSHPSTTFTEAALGMRHTILLDSEGAVYAIGDNRNLQLGSAGPSSSSPRLVPVPPTSSISSGWSHCIAVTKTRTPTPSPQTRPKWGVRLQTCRRPMSSSPKTSGRMPPQRI